MSHLQPTGTQTYRWECPICGTSRLAVYDAADRFRAVNALRTHIQSTDGSGHGPVHAVPDGIGGVLLAACVTDL